MKKFLLSAFSVVALATAAVAQPTLTVQDSISVNTTWGPTQQYLLKGYVYVTAGTTLTIEPGVIIKGDKNTKGSLIIERGAKLIANGTPASPIVFTSNQPIGQRSYGDWGGVILCGKAPVNWRAGFAQVEGGPRSLYGGTDVHDNSGSLSFVRIEYPGVAFSPNNEINGLTLCGVGDATNLDHIQVSYSGDDSYEWFGGSVNGKFLVALAGWDDDFDTDNGYTGKNQFVFGLRDPFAADQSGSKAFESDSYQSGTASGLLGNTNDSITRPIFSNVTAIGPLVSNTSTNYDNQFVSGAHIRRGSSISILNSIIGGYPCGILIDESSASFGSTTANLQSNNLQIRNTIVAGTGITTPPYTNFGIGKDVMYVKDGARSLTPTTADADTTTGTPFGTASGPYGWFLTPKYGNKIYASVTNGVRLQNPFNLTNPNPVPTSTSPVCYSSKLFVSWGAVPADIFNPNLPISYDTTSPATYNVPGVPPDFDSSKANDPFFSRVNFVGAFSGTGTTNDNWMNGWCNFNPNNTDYTHVASTYVTQAPLAVTQAKLYPNPAGEVAYLAMNLTAASTVSITVADVTGKIVANVFQGENVIGENRFAIDLTNMTTGMYFVNVVTDNMHKSYKLNVIK
jgi:Secretion system C-terminal sorting domain